MAEGLEMPWAGTSTEGYQGRRAAAHRAAPTGPAPAGPEEVPQGEADFVDWIAGLGTEDAARERWATAPPAPPAHGEKGVFNEGELATAGSTVDWFTDAPPGAPEGAPPAAAQHMAAPPMDSPPMPGPPMPDPPMAGPPMPSPPMAGPPMPSPPMPGPP
ncbi:MAG: hypothetical protein J2P15_07750, partial [Micromonosporaceae bacterium]|nr:hypothetical protein [Micromonosporaceae bacterium]